MAPRTIITNEYIKNLLKDQSSEVLEIKENVVKSKSKVTFKCIENHISNDVRFDSINDRIALIKRGERYKLCTECHTDAIKNVQLEEHKKLISDTMNVNGVSGFKLVKEERRERTTTENSDILFFISCPLGHITEKLKNVFSTNQGYNCKECFIEDKLNSTESMCSRCRKLLDNDKFNSDKSKINGKDHTCRECREKERIIRKSKGYKFPSKPEIIVNEIKGKLCSVKNCGWHSYTEYYNDKSHMDGFSKDCKKCKDKYSRDYVVRNRKKCYISKKLYREKNKETLREKSRIYSKNNRKILSEKHRIYVMNRYKNDPEFKMIRLQRHRILEAIKDVHVKKKGNTKKLIGCEPLQFLEHIKPQLKDGMTLENHGKVWHYDHIIPINSFNLNSKIEQMRCFNFLNVRPMLATENLSKGTKYKFDINLEIKLFFQVLKDYAPRKLTGLGI
jgi:hypothetical protein